MTGLELILIATLAGIGTGIHKNIEQNQHNSAERVKNYEWVEVSEDECLDTNTCYDFDINAAKELDSASN